MEYKVSLSKEAWEFVDKLKHGFDDQEAEAGGGGGGRRKGEEEEEEEKLHCHIIIKLLINYDKEKILKAITQNSPIIYKNKYVEQPEYIYTSDSNFKCHHHFEK